jgi:hypothetical protein
MNLCNPFYWICFSTNENSLLQLAADVVKRTIFLPRSWFLSIKTMRYSTYSPIRNIRNREGPMSFPVSSPSTRCLWLWCPVYWRYPRRLFSCSRLSSNKILHTFLSSLSFVFTLFVIITCSRYTNFLTILLNVNKTNFYGLKSLLPGTLCLWQVRPTATIR